VTAEEILILERLTIVAPLGFRFRDAVTGAIIDDGLSVVAYSAENPLRRVEAFTNRKGVFAFRGLPGMRDVEYPAEDSNPLDSLSGKWNYVVEVADKQGRFIPFRLNVKAPVKGLYRWGAVQSPPPVESPVLLYSAPARPVLPAMAVVRAELWDPVLDRPAAWALVDAVIDGAVKGRGISDAHGRLLLMFPYPEPKDGPASPPAASPTRLVDRKWPLQLQSFYSPDSPVPAIPDLNKVFEQTEATLWQTLSPGTPLGPLTLKYGSELVLASQSKSELLITPLSSP
jgi:hypothetical protein